MAGLSLRDYIDLVSLNEAGRDTPWGTETTPLFDETLAKLVMTRPVLRDKVKQFMITKLPDPLSNRFGQYDRPFTGPAIKGFQHCHLGPDYVLIYTLTNRKINLVYLCQHAEIEGKRMRATAKRLAPYAPK